MISTIKLSGLIYLLQIIQIPCGCGELLQINVQNQVIDKLQCQFSGGLFLTSLDKIVPDTEQNKHETKIRS